MPPVIERILDLVGDFFPILILAFLGILLPALGRIFEAVRQGGGRDRPVTRGETPRTAGGTDPDTGAPVETPADRPREEGEILSEVRRFLEELKDRDQEQVPGGVDRPEPPPVMAGGRQGFPTGGGDLPSSAPPWVPPRPAVSPQRPPRVSRQAGAGRRGRRPPLAPAAQPAREAAAPPPQALTRRRGRRPYDLPGPEGPRHGAPVSVILEHPGIAILSAEILGPCRALVDYGHTATTPPGLRDMAF